MSDSFIKGFQRGAMWAVLLFAAGAVVAAGSRAAEWLIPKPESRIFVCWASDTTNVEACKSVEALLERAKP